MSAAREDMGAAREALHQLVDELPEEQVSDSLSLLRARRERGERLRPFALFPVPQLMRTGHPGAAFGWVAVAGVGLTLLIFGLVVAFTLSPTEGAVILVPGVVALLMFAVGSTVHARHAPDLWNAAADERHRQTRADAVERGTRAD